MKHGMEPERSLKNAFPDMPRDCYDALMRAARSVEEEKKMKKATLRTALVFALIIVSTITAALAASELLGLGWTDFFTQYGDQAIVPKAAQDVLNETPAQTYELGPLTFTVRQLMCDGRLAVSTTDIRTTDGSPALYCIDPYDCLGCNGENGRQLADRLGLPWETTYADAARQLGLPLYWPRAMLECEDCEGGMEDPLWNEDNTMTYFSMAYLTLKEMPDALPAELLLRVDRFDPETEAEVEGETVRQRAPLQIPVHSETEERTYRPEAPFSASGLTLQSVRAERTIAGVYLYADFTAEEGVDFWEVYTSIRFLDEQGQPFPRGMSLSGYLDTDHLPNVVVGDMAGLEQLPSRMILEVGERRILVE